MLNITCSLYLNHKNLFITDICDSWSGYSALFQFSMFLEQKITKKCQETETVIACLGEHARMSMIENGSFLERQTDRETETQRQRLQ